MLYLDLIVHHVILHAYHVLGKQRLIVLFVILDYLKVQEFVDMCVPKEPTQIQPVHPV